MRLALTIGDPNGIGPEVVLKSLRALPAGVDPVVVGARAVLEHYAARLGLESTARDLDVVDVGGGDEIVIEEGVISAAAGSLAMAAVDSACSMCIDGSAAAMVTGPISKEAINLAGHAFPGHTEFLAERTGADDFVMLMASDVLRVALVTTHLPLRLVAENVTVESVSRTLTRLDEGLRSDFGIDTPRIALLALNPHAGDGGVIGTEEIDVLAPAVEAARMRGIGVTGPHAADGFFGRRAYADHDAVLACYHDQGLAPFKALSMGGGVNVTLGLPIVRTAPDHGTAFGIAGAGVADPSSFIAAAKMATEIASRRGRRG